MTSPMKRNSAPKRKGGPPTQVYRRVELPLLTNHAANDSGGDELASASLSEKIGDGENDHTVREPKKKNPTPTSSESSAVAAS